MKKLNTPLKIKAEKIALPTSGVTIDTCTLLHTGDAGTSTISQRFQLYVDTDMYSIEGRIHPVDHEAQDIHFELGIPLKWNGKLIQAGGGGLDGYVIPSIFPMTGQDPEKSALKQGYAVVGSDGGHSMEEGNPWGCRWALNKEMLMNFASEQLKKTKDAASILLEMVMGKQPDKVYFYGGSNGGRECMKAIQNYPDDYDGAICFFPVLYWVLKILADCRIADALEDYGDKGIINAKLQEKIKQIALEVCDNLDGASDGLVSNLCEAAKKSVVVEEKIKKLLTKEQFEILRKIGDDMSVPFPLGYGEVTLPGYQIYEGTPINLHLTSTPEKRESGPAAGGDEFLKYAVVGEENYDVRHFEPENWKTELQNVSKLLDAYSTNLDRFFEKGGKLLMVQGTADPLVCVYGTNQYYERLIERYGKEKLDQSMRYYVVPGFGHGPGGDFLLSTDMIGALDQWVVNEISPKDMIAVDLNESTRGRTRPLCEYPSFPHYTGQGDINEADSFVKK